MKWRGEGGVVALQNEFTETFIYNFLKVFAQKEMSFILTFLQNVELCQIQGLVGLKETTF